MPMHPRVLSATKRWKKGRLVVMRTYSGLNAWRDRVRYEIGFWRPARKHKKGSVNLMVDDQRWSIIDRAGWQARSPVPWHLRWIPYLSR